MKESIDKLVCQDVGCMLGPFKTNVIAYADDIVIMCPSANGLQILLDNFQESIKSDNLTINVKKSKYMIMKHAKSFKFDPKVYLNQVPLERVYEHKYLGIIIMDSLSNSSDADRATNSFLKQFNSMYYRFNFAEKNVLNYLFKTYSSSFYGIELWYNDKNRKKVLRTPAVAYHKAVKKICSLSPYDSNHYACEIVGVDIFTHLQSKRMFKYCYSLLKSDNDFMRKIKYYISFQSHIKKNVSRIFRSEYDVVNVFLNDFDAVYSRINYVQKNEPRSIFLNSI